MIAVFASGKGSNFNSLCQKFGRRIALLICDSPNAGCLSLAREHSVAISLLERDSFASRHAHEQAMIEALPTTCSLIVLAGFMRILSAEFLNNLRLRTPAVQIINLHPAHLDEYKGPDGYAFAHFHKYPRWGITVHHVTAPVDSGEVIAQTEVPLYPYENLQTFRNRSQDSEHKLLINAVTNLVPNLVPI